MIGGESVRFFSTLSVLLLLVNSALIYLHYTQYVEASEQEEKVLTYRQEVEVINRPDALHIYHHFSNLQNNRYEIDWPEQSIDRLCGEDEEALCNRLNEEVTAILEGEDEAQTIAYKIPKQSAMQDVMLFSQIFASLRNANTESTILHVTDEMNVGGVWISGLRPVGTKTLEHLSYSFYHGAGSIDSLIWQKERLPITYNSNQLTVYGEVISPEDIAAMGQALQISRAPHLDIVINRQQKKIVTDRIFMTGDDNIQSIIYEMVSKNVRKIYRIPPELRAVSDFVASILLEKEVGSEAAIAMYRATLNSLTEEQQEQFKLAVRTATAEPVTAQTLDEIYGHIVGLNTTYFTKQVESYSDQFTLVVDDPRKLLINGEEVKEVVRVRDGKVYFPASILRHAQYEVSSNEQSVYVISPERNFRFSRVDPFYVFNDQKYTVNSTPFALINGEVFFEESWFKRLFQLGIEKTADAISILPVGQTTEGTEAE